MIEHMKHVTGNERQLSEIFSRYDAKINELIRVVNELSIQKLTPAKKKKLEKINLLKKQLKQLEMEL